MQSHTCLSAIRCGHSRGMARLGITACLLLLGTASHADDGPAFAAFYELSVASDQIEELWVTISVQVLNESDADVLDVTITLEDSHLAGTSYGSFPYVPTFFNGESVSLNSDFLVPRREYEWWRTGSHPTLQIEFQDADGDTVRQIIEPIMLPQGDQ